MTIQIDDNRKISAIQKEFNRLFPYLKIEFYKTPHKIGTPSPKGSLLLPENTIGQCRLAHYKGGFAITPEMTVAELEQNFSDVFALHVQVFRKSGKLWLQTTVTDSWTLEQQNNQGQELSGPGRVRYEEDQVAR